MPEFLGGLLFRAGPDVHPDFQDGHYAFGRGLLETDLFTLAIQSGLIDAQHFRCLH